MLLAAADPANPYGAAIAWPDRSTRPATSGTPINTTSAFNPSNPSNPSSTAPGQGHKPGRKAGALVVLVDGELVLYVERGGRTVLSWTDSPELLASAAQSVAAAVRDGRVGALTVVTTDGIAVLTAGSNATPTPVAAALIAAGFTTSPQGLRLRQ